MEAPKVLYIGVDSGIAAIVTTAIHLRWPEVTPLHADSGREALGLAEQELPDLILLYPDLGDMTMHEVIRDLRQFPSGSAPILVLGRESDEMEAVTAFESGADDYIRLPCPLSEFFWRIVRSIIRS